METICKEKSTSLFGYDGPKLWLGPQSIQIVGSQKRFSEAGIHQGFVNVCSRPCIFYTISKMRNIPLCFIIGCIRKQWEISGKVHTGICQCQCHCECHSVQFIGLDHCSRGRSCIQFINQLLPFRSDPHSKILVSDEKDNDG